MSGPWHGQGRPPAPHDPWAAARGAWGPAPQPYQVPAPRAAGPAPVRGDTGRYRVMSGLRRPAPAPVYYPPRPGYGPPGYRAPGYAPRPVPPVRPAAPPRPVPHPQWWMQQPRRAPVVTPPPPPPRSAAPVVLGILAAVGAVVLLLVGVVVVLVNPGGSATSTSASRSAYRYPTVSSTRQPRPSSSRTTPFSTPTTTPTPTGPAALNNNPLFRDFNAGLVRQPCTPAGFPNDAPSGQAFFDSIIPCLETGWRPVITAAGLEYHNPSVLVPSGTTISSPCGTQGPGTFVAFYCSGNQTLYMPIDVLRADVLPNQALRYVSTFAHEFGHHVQMLAGIMDESWAERRANGTSSPAGLELSRRTELQAQCFSGMFSGSISNAGGVFTSADYNLIASYENRNENVPPDHGTPSHQQGWWRQGGDDNQVGQCNTWLSPPSDVS